MAKPVSSVPNLFATASTTIPLSQLDADFASIITNLNDLALYSNYIADTGSANAVVLNYPSGITTTQLTTGLTLTFKANLENTGATTLTVQVNSITIGAAAAIVSEDGSALSGGELRANGIYTVVYNGGTWTLAGGGGGGGAEAGGAIYENTQSINANYTITTNKNGFSVGPITVASGVSVTVPAGSRYVIL